MNFAEIRAVVSDMDGVLWRQDEPLPGLLEFFDVLSARQLPFALATNNSSKTRQDYVRKLEKMGVPGVQAESIITSGTATAAYLKKHYPAGTPMYVFGSYGLHDVVREAGFAVSQNGDAQVVVAGLNWELTYDDLRRAAYLIRDGADFVGTNPDTTFPTPEGLAPGAGSMLAALQAATDVEPVIIGKPHPPMFEAALDLLGTPPDSTLMIGDRLNTDIAGAALLGMKTAIVLTGISTAEEIHRSELKPDVMFDDLRALVAALAAE